MVSEPRRNILKDPQPIIPTPPRNIPMSSTVMTGSERKQMGLTRPPGLGDSSSSENNNSRGEAPKEK